MHCDSTCNVKQNNTIRYSVGLPTYLIHWIQYQRHCHKLILSTNVTKTDYTSNTNNHTTNCIVIGYTRHVQKPFLSINFFQGIEFKTVPVYPFVQYLVVHVIIHLIITAQKSTCMKTLIIISYVILWGLDSIIIHRRTQLSVVHKSTKDRYSTF